MVGKQHVYGPIYATGIGDFPHDLSSTQRMMTRAEWADSYADCAACHAGRHHHEPAR